MCQSCRGTIRSSSGSLCNPPYDLCVASLGKRQYWNSITNKQYVPSNETNSHYCAHTACIQYSFPTFVPTSLVVPEDVSSRLLIRTTRQMSLVSHYKYQYMGRYIRIWSLGWAALGCGLASALLRSLVSQTANG